MPEHVRIQCICTANRFDPLEKITHIGGRNPNGTPWKLPLRDAIAGIESDIWDFFVEVGGHPVDVVAATYQGCRYLKTAVDGIHPSSLLGLPECPADLAMTLPNSWQRG